MKTSSTRVLFILSWLGLTGANSVVSLAHGEDPLAGRRLFFTETQRADATLKVPVDSSGSKSQPALQEHAESEETRVSGASRHASKAMTDPLSTRHDRASASGQAGSSNDYHVYFTGLVTGMHEARILVNGLPCESVQLEHDVKIDQPLPIHCHGVRDDELRLTVSIATATLFVTGPAGRVHHLSPGEGM